MTDKSATELKNLRPATTQSDRTGTENFGDPEINGSGFSVVMSLGIVELSGLPSVPLDHWGYAQLPSAFRNLPSSG
jgi:hypothetical protein